MKTTIMGVTIRPFLPADYSEIVRLHNANFAPDFTLDAEKLQHLDRSRAAHCEAARWVAMCCGRAVGYASYSQHGGLYHPRKFEVELSVEPGYMGRGIGSQLYERLIDELQRFDPLRLHSWSRENMPRLVGFLNRRGFVEIMRVWVSELDLTALDPRRFAHAAPAVEAQGIQLRSLADLNWSDPIVRRKLYEMWSEVRHDIPLPPGEQRVDVSFEQWQEENDHPKLLPPGYFVAIDGDTYVGVSQLWLSAPDEPDTLRTGLTGVRRAYRRRGVALALKMRALEFAKAQGYKRVFTENASSNRGMLSINERLGFTKYPAWVHYAKSMAE